MTVEVLVIGIGTGNPEHLTQEAVAALRRVDVFLVADKRPDTDDLVVLREEICRRFVPDGGYRFVEVPDPPRGPDRDRDATAYRAGVESWHQRRAERYAEVIRAEVMGAGETGAGRPGDGVGVGRTGTVGFLVWGDPAFYDSTIRIVERVAATGLELELTVVPGISSVQLLAARHRIVLNRIGRPVHLTTGRRLVDEYDPGLGDVVVMLDPDLACAGLLDRHPGLQIFWGAQLGLPDEVLVAGVLADQLERIRALRLGVRARRGWVMDTYLLRPLD